MAPEVVVGLAVGLAIAGAIVYLVWRLEKRRTEAMREACRAMSFTFLEEPGDDLILAVGDLPLFDRGHTRVATNMMKGRLADREVALVDYQYTTGSGKTQIVYRQTVVVFPDGATGVADFELAPENILHKIGGVFGYQDIDFPESEGFSKRYLLRGEDDGGVRGAFTAQALAFFGENPGWSVQSRGGRLAVFRSSRRCKPQEAPTLLANALRIQSLFAAASAT